MMVLSPAAMIAGSPKLRDEKGGVGYVAIQWSDERLGCSAGMTAPEGSRGRSSEVLRGMSDVGV